MRALRFLLCLAAVQALAGPEIKVWIDLRDKGPGAPAEARAFEDAPVHAPYLDSLRAAGVRVVTALKWQNRVSGWVDPERLTAVAALPFVGRVEEMPFKAPSPAPSAPPALPKPQAPAHFGEFDSLFLKTGAARLRDTLAARGLRAGQGLRIALLDADFHMGHQAFDSLFAGNRILDQHDFVAGAPTAVDRTLAYSHGATVLSLIAADLPGVMTGLAPKAGFLLYRTEDEANEAYVEEDFLAAALERAVDSGAQVINISLGYRYDFDHEPDFPYSHMDGRTRPSSLAALGAARRGAIVVAAVGNETAQRYGEPTVTAPADADSILAIGMVTAAGARCAYSSTGPTFDGRRKPELSSLGCAVRVAHTGTANGARNEAGTSVGAPVLAGVAALLRQLHPESSGATAQSIRQALIATADRADAPDNFVGSGLVRAAAAHCLLAFGTADCPPTTSVAVHGMFVWTGGNTSRFPWPNPLDTGRARAWDLQGRAVPLAGDLDPHGNVRLRSQGRRAPSPLILRIPALAEP